MNDITRIESLSHTGRELLDAHDETKAHGDFYRWDSYVAEWLDHLAPGSGLSAQWSALPASNLSFGSFYANGPEAWGSFRQAVQKRLLFLSNVASSLRSSSANPAGDKMESTPTQSSIASGKVFVVHGRNETFRESVARYIEKLGLTPIILHEKPNAGRTIIEKFVHFSDVSFAVVILTGDDRGGIATESHEQYQTRARQNVIFELGFFIAKLGRANVCALYESGVELPSDYDGVVFIEIDKAGAWRLQLAREMKHAHLSIDMNNAI